MPTPEELEIQSRIQNVAQRTKESFLSSWTSGEPPALTRQLAQDFRNVGDAFYVIATEIDAYLDDLEGQPVPGPDPNDRWQLDGKPMPPRPDVPLNGARDKRYGVKLDKGEGLLGAQLSGVQSAGALLFGDTSLVDALIWNSDGDAIKYDGGDPANRGPIRVESCHAFYLGLKSGAHADFFQTQGGLPGAEFVDNIADMPANAGDGSRSNACYIFNASQGSNGHIYIRGGISRGGNRTFMMDDKGTSNDPGYVHVSNHAIIVEEDSPRYSILPPAWAHRFDFDDRCGIYYLNKDTGLCELLTRDVFGFDHMEWHREKFGRDPVS